jgi:hypothetical protein
MVNDALLAAADVGGDVVAGVQIAGAIRNDNNVGAEKGALRQGVVQKRASESAALRLELRAAVGTVGRGVEDGADSQN